MIDVNAAVAALTGATRREWELFKEYMDREYEAEVRRIALSQEMGASVLRKLHSEQGLGKAAVKEGDRQTRMF